MKRVVTWFAETHVASNLLMGLIIVSGLLAVPNIKQEVFPELRPNVVSVTVPYPGAAPQEVENGICLKIEEEVQAIEGIERLTASAAEGVGSVSLELVSGADVSKVLDEVKNAIDAITTFPEDAEEPIVSEVTLSSPVIDVVISGALDERTLKSLGQRVEEEIASLPGITHTQLTIARPDEISIEVSEEALRRHGLTFDEVAQAVRRSSLDLPGGSVKTIGGEVLLRTVGQAYEKSAFEKLVLTSRPDGSRLLLGDVATVVDGFSDTGQEAIFDGESAVMVQVSRVGKQRATDVANTVHDYVARLSNELPPGVSVTTWNDDAAILQSRLDLLIRNGRAGFVLVFMILALFLRIRLAFWVALGIPISFLGAIWLMPTLGVSISLISLFAFIVVLGLAVDDAIVVGESVFFKLQQGLPATQAAIEGTTRVTIPVVFGILTTIAAFSPLLFLPGTTGDIWAVIPMIVIPVLAFSLVESLLILPSHLSDSKSFVFLMAIVVAAALVLAGALAALVVVILGVVFLLARRVDWMVSAARFVGRGWEGVRGRFDNGLRWLVEDIYTPLLDFSLRRRYLVLAIGLATFLLTAGYTLGGFIRFTFFPRVQADSVVALVTMPLGTPVSQTKEALERISSAADVLRDEAVRESGEGAFRHVLTSVGEQPYRNRQRGPNAGTARFVGEHLGEVTIELAPAEELEIDGIKLARRWRELVGPIPDAVELVYSSSLFSSGEPINVQLASSDLDQLNGAAEALKEALSKYSGVFDISESFRSGKQELKLDIKPEAEALGISLADLARQVRQAFFGEEAQRVQRAKEDVKVMVRLPEENRRSLAGIENLRIRGPGGTEVPFSTVALAEMGQGFSTIRRADRQRVNSVTADIDEDLGNANEVNASLVAMDLPEILAEFPRVTYSFEGQRKQQNETLSYLVRGFAIAIFVIFGLLAIPLRSYGQPWIVMAAIPFGFVGAVWGHVLMRMDLTMLSMAGLVALSGVVVNDSLVMIDFVNRSRRRDGMSVLEASRNAGVARFRAILLTSLTTFAGVSPLLLERSLQAQFLKPLAVSLGFGVMFATFVILILVPTAYLVLDDLARGTRRLLGTAGANTKASASA